MRKEGGKGWARRGEQCYIGRNSFFHAHNHNKRLTCARIVMPVAAVSMAAVVVGVF